MTLKQLKEQERACISSSRTTIKQQGITYRDILNICNQDTSFRLSDELFISDCAKKYIDNIKKEFERIPLSKQDDNLKIRASCAKNLVINKTLSFQETFELFNNINDLEDESFIKQFLIEKNIYTKIRPEIYQNVIELIKINRKIETEKENEEN